MSKPAHPAPPRGFASWLDYAVESFDTRALELETKFDDQPGPSRDAMRAAARAEFQALKIAAAAAERRRHKDAHED